MDAIDDAPPSDRRRSWRRASLVLLVWLLPLHAVALVFVVAAATTRGVLAGACGLAPLVALAIGAVSRRRAHDAATAAVGFVALAILAALAATGPRATPAGRVASVWRDGAPTSSPAWWIPEIDQVLAGAALAPILDPLLTLHDTPRLQEMVRRVYGPALRDPDLPAGNALHEMWTFGDGAHTYVIEPPTPSASRLGVVFLHGSGGNFFGYLALWKKIADATGAVVVLPSYGFGNWDQRGGADVVARARALAIARGADPNRIVLAGLSNGGKGVTRALRDHGADWSAALLLSSVSEPDVLARVRGCNGKRVLVMHGARDDRVPVSLAQAAAASLARAGCRATLDVNEAQDHFWFFAEPDVVVAKIATWLEVTSAEQAARSAAAPATPP